MHPKDADGMANSVDPDQTASSEAVSGLKIYTRPLVFTSSLSVRASENCYWLALSDE